ncbi:hypothetical protein ACQPTN_20060 [Bradyrhizobium sp. 13971]
MIRPVGSPARAAATRIPSTTSTASGWNTCCTTFFAAARLDIEITDRFGKKVKPREWFLLPSSIIGEAVARLKDGSIVNYRYDRDGGALIQIGVRES